MARVVDILSILILAVSLVTAVPTHSHESASSLKDPKDDPFSQLPVEMVDKILRIQGNSFTIRDWLSIASTSPVLRKQVASSRLWPVIQSLVDMKTSFIQYYNPMCKEFLRQARIPDIVDGNSIIFPLFVDPASITIDSIEHTKGHVANEFDDVASHIRCLDTFYYALQQRSLELAKTLVVTLPPQDVSRAKKGLYLEYAIAEGSKPGIQTFINSVEEPLQSQLKSRVLMDAIISDDVEFVKWVIDELDTNVNTLYYYQRPMVIAIRGRNLEILSLLLDRGAHVAQEDHHLLTPVDELFSVRMLLESAASGSIVNNELRFNVIGI